MANTFIKIQTVTVGSGGSASIAFTSIPQTYTDLQIFISSRTNRADASDYFTVSFNSDTTGANYSYRDLIGSGSAASSTGSTSSTSGGETVGNNATASVFGNGQIYIANYTSSNHKLFNNETVAENNLAASFMNMTSGVWKNTAAITSISLIVGIGPNFNEFTTATLYGIKSS
jgi:hypothetical protein